jgi:hypothetical protein
MLSRLSERSRRTSFVEIHRPFETLEFREPYRIRGVQSFGDKRAFRRIISAPCREGVRSSNEKSLPLLGLIAHKLTRRICGFGQGGGESVSQSPLKDKAFSTFLDQNPPFELPPENEIPPSMRSRQHRLLLEAFDGKPRVIANAREIGGRNLFTVILAWPTGQALHATKSRRVAGMGRTQACYFSTLSSPAVTFADLAAP